MLSAVTKNSLCGSMHRALSAHPELEKGSTEEGSLELGFQQELPWQRPGDWGSPGLGAMCLISWALVLSSTEEKAALGGSGIRETVILDSLRTI